MAPYRIPTREVLIKALMSMDPEGPIQKYLRSC